MRDDGAEAPSLKQSLNVFSLYRCDGIIVDPNVEWVLVTHFPISICNTLSFTCHFGCTLLRFPSASVDRLHSSRRRIQRESIKISEKWKQIGSRNSIISSIYYISQAHTTNMRTWTCILHTIHMTEIEQRARATRHNDLAREAEQQQRRKKHNKKFDSRNSNETAEREKTWISREKESHARFDAALRARRNRDGYIEMQEKEKNNQRRKPFLRSPHQNILPTSNCICSPLYRRSAIVLSRALTKPAIQFVCVVYVCNKYTRLSLAAPTRKRASERAL